jgi:hypothetical protein
MATPVMEPNVTYAGWRDLDTTPTKVTPDYATADEAGAAVQAYARKRGLEVRDVPFYIVESTVTYQPLVKTTFSITATTVPA